MCDGCDGRTGPSARHINARSVSRTTVECRLRTRIDCRTVQDSMLCFKLFIDKRPQGIPYDASVQPAYKQGKSDQKRRSSLCYIVSRGIHTLQRFMYSRWLCSKLIQNYPQRGCSKIFNAIPTYVSIHVLARSITAS